MTKEISVNYDYGNTTDPTNDHDHKIIFTKDNTDYCVTINNCNHSDLHNIDRDALVEHYKNLPGETAN